MGIGRGACACNGLIGALIQKVRTRLSAGARGIRTAGPTYDRDASQNTFFKTANVLNKLPKSQQPKAKRSLQEIWMAETSKDAEAAFDAFIAAYMPKYDKAAKCLAKDRQALLAFYDLPAEHWKHLRTSNPIESTFATVRHAPSDRRAASRTRRRWRWCSSSSMPPRKAGAGSMASTSCPSSSKVSGLPTASKSPPTRLPLSPKPPPPEPQAITKIRR